MTWLGSPAVASFVCKRGEVFSSYHAVFHWNNIQKTTASQLCCNNGWSFLKTENMLTSSSRQTMLQIHVKVTFWFCWNKEIPYTYIHYLELRLMSHETKWLSYTLQLCPWSSNTWPIVWQLFHFLMYFFAIYCLLCLFFYFENKSPNLSLFTGQVNWIQTPQLKNILLYM